MKENAKGRNKQKKRRENPPPPLGRLAQLATRPPDRPTPASTIGLAHPAPPLPYPPTPQGPETLTHHSSPTSFPSFPPIQIGSGLARSHAHASGPTTPPPGPRRRLFPTGLLPPPPPACFPHLNGLPPRRPVVAVNRLAPRCQSPYGPSEPRLAPSLSLVRSRSSPRSPPISPAVDALRPRPMRVHRAVAAPSPP